MHEIKLSTNPRDLVFLIFYYDVFVRQFSYKAVQGLKKLLIVYVLLFFAIYLCADTALGVIVKIAFYAITLLFILIGIDVLRKRLLPYKKNKETIDFYKTGSSFLYDKEQFKLVSDNQEYNYVWTSVGKTYATPKNSLIIEMKDKSSIYVPIEDDQDKQNLLDFLKGNNIYKD